MSYFFAAEPPRSPAAMFTTRYGISRFPMIFSSIARRRSCSSHDVSGVANENISTLSNWCTRNIPPRSFPYEPASRRKQVE